MRKVYTIEEIAAAVKPVAEKYGIEKVWLFGSYARGEATEDSDVDLLVDSKRIMNMFELGGLSEDLKEALGKDVDIITVSALYHSVNLPLNAMFRSELERERKAIYE